MNEIDDRLRRDLAALADRMPITDLTEPAVRRGHQRRLRRTTILATTGIAIVVAAIVVPITVIGHPTTPNPRAEFPRPITASNNTPSPPPIRPSTLDNEFRVAAPVLQFPRGGLLPKRRACTAKDLTATATTRRTSDGIVGVVELKGRHCAIQQSNGPSALLAADGQGLPAALAGTQDDSGGDPNADYASHNGDVVWGFSWTGSSCGARAAAVAIPVNLQPPASLVLSGVRITAPLHGPQLACHGSSKSTVIDGPAGAPGDAVLPAPTAWHGLVAHLAMAPTNDGMNLTRIRVTLSNSTASEITLAPCPMYALRFTSKTGRGKFGGVLVDGAGGDLCSSSTTVIPEHRSVTIPLPDATFGQGAPVNRHSTMTATFAMAGVPQASAHSRVR